MHEFISKRDSKDAMPRHGRTRNDLAHFTVEPLAAVSDPASILLRKASCACGGGCPACQAKSSDLKISHPNDPAEIEADQIADRVMRMSVGDARASTSNSSSQPTIHRKCNACEEEDEQIKRKPLPSPGGIGAQSPAHVQSAISSGGRPLDKETRNFFEPRFGYDFSSVRIYTGSTAGQSAHSINARAYTQGNNIVFGSGEYRPETESGRRLLAHELAHTTQQGGIATIRRTCVPPVPDGEQLWAGNESVATRELITSGEEDRLTIRSLHTTGVQGVPGLKTKFIEANLDPDASQPLPPLDCSGTGVRYPYPPGNSLGIETVELCKKGEKIYFTFSCGSRPEEKSSQREEKKCLQTYQEVLEAGHTDLESIKATMREFLSRTDPLVYKMVTIAIAYGCDEETGLAYYQIASSLPGPVPKKVRDLVGGMPGNFRLITGEQPKSALQLVGSEEEKAKLRRRFPEDAEQILADLQNTDVEVRQFAQLCVYVALNEDPNMHAERTAIQGFKTPGDAVYFVMPSRPACPVCQGAVQMEGVLLLDR
ncbi:MAG: DUF4157 domain-containing protein [Pyrinomonadaceae bacterium]